MASCLRQSARPSRGAEANRRCSEWLRDFLPDNFAAHAELCCRKRDWRSSVQDGAGAVFQYAEWRRRAAAAQTQARRAPTAAEPNRKDRLEALADWQSKTHAAATETDTTRQGPEQQGQWLSAACEKCGFGPSLALLLPKRFDSVAAAAEAEALLDARSQVGSGGGVKAFRQENFYTTLQEVQQREEAALQSGALRGPRRALLGSAPQALQLSAPPPRGRVNLRGQRLLYLQWKLSEPAAAGLCESAGLDEFVFPHQLMPAYSAASPLGEARGAIRKKALPSATDPSSPESSQQQQTAAIDALQTLTQEMMRDLAPSADDWLLEEQGFGCEAEGTSQPQLEDYVLHQEAHLRRLQNACAVNCLL